MLGGGPGVTGASGSRCCYALVSVIVSVPSTVRIVMLTSVPQWGQAGGMAFWVQVVKRLDQGLVVRF